MKWLTTSAPYARRRPSPRVGTGRAFPSRIVALASRGPKLSADLRRAIAAHLALRHRPRKESMSNDVEMIVKEKVGQRRRELEAFQLDGQRAARLAAEVRGLRVDLAKEEDRLARLKAAGKSHLEIPNPASGHYAHWGIVEFEPLRSVKTGNELAKAVQQQIAEIHNEIERREAAIAELLG